MPNATTKILNEWTRGESNAHSSACKADVLTIPLRVHTKENTTFIRFKFYKCDTTYKDC